MNIRHRPTPRLLGYTAVTLALGAVLAAGFAVAGAGVAVADPAPAPAPAVPDPGVRPSPNPAVTEANPTQSPIGPPPTAPAPNPTTPTPAPAPGPTPGSPPVDDGTEDPGLFDIPGQVRKAITDFFAWVVESALNPVLSALGEALLTSPDLPADERVRTMWTTSLVVANAVFVLFVVLAGFVVASRETLQTSYGVKEILPRLAVAGILANTSLLVTGKAIEAANAITAGIAGEGVDGKAAAAALTQALGEAVQGNNFLLSLMVLGVLVMAIAVVFTFVLRIVLLTILIGIAPLPLICHALPQTEHLAFTWWRALAACLGIQVGQAVVLLAALRMFLTPADGQYLRGPGFLIGVPTPSRLLSILLVAAVVWVLWKIPGWTRQFVLGPLARSGGRGLVGQIVHTVIMVKTLGAAVGLARGGAAVGRAAGTRRTARAATATRTSRPRRVATGRTPPRPSRLGRSLGRPTRAPGPAMFSHAPAAHTALPDPTGASGPVPFSHTPALTRGTPSPAPAGGVPPVPFSHPPSASSPARRPSAARSTPARFSHSDHPPATPARPAGTRTPPPAAAVFSSAPRPQTAPRRPPTPGSTPVFSAATKPDPSPATRRTGTPARTPATPPPRPTRNTPPAATRGTPTPRATPRPSRATPAHQPKPPWSTRE